MKKTAIAIAILCVTTTATVYAETTTGPTTYTVTTTTETTETTQPSKPAAKPAAPAKNNNNSGSFVDSVRSGWNSFIDVLTGTKDPGK